MKQSAEQQIKKAVEVWDNQKNDIGFDKTALWNSIQMQTAKSDKVFPWLKVAAVALILLFSGALSYNIHSNIQLKRAQVLLLSEIEKQQGKPPKTIVKKEVEIKYNTKIKEVVPKEIAGKLTHLETELTSIQAENKQLKAQIHDQELYSHLLKDSISKLITNNQLQEKMYQQQLAYLKEQDKDSDFTIDINEEALMALSETIKPTPQNKAQAKTGLQFKLQKNSNVKETSAPIFNDITIK